MIISKLIKYIRENMQINFDQYVAELDIPGDSAAAIAEQDAEDVFARLCRATEESERDTEDVFARLCRATETSNRNAAEKAEQERAAAAAEEDDALRRAIEASNRNAAEKAEQERAAAAAEEDDALRRAIEASIQDAAEKAEQERAAAAEEEEDDALRRAIEASIQDAAEKAEQERAAAARVQKRIAPNPPPKKTSRKQEQIPDTMLAQLPKCGPVDSLFTAHGEIRAWAQRLVGLDPKLWNPDKIFDHFDYGMVVMATRQYQNAVTKNPNLAIEHYFKGCPPYMMVEFSRPWRTHKSLVNVEDILRADGKEDPLPTRIKPTMNGFQ